MSQTSRDARPSRGTGLDTPLSASGRRVPRLAPNPDAFGEATGTPLEVRTGPARPGDVVGCASRTDKAREVLGWSAERSLVDGVRDSLAWSEKLPAVLSEEATR